MRIKSHENKNYNRREVELINLFVEICFLDIDNPVTIYQFSQTALMLDYSKKEIEWVVEVGQRQYRMMCQGE